jgi:hypothetical protein
VLRLVPKPTRSLTVLYHVSIRDTVSLCCTPRTYTFSVACFLLLIARGHTAISPASSRCLIQLFSGRFSVSKKLISIRAKTEVFIARTRRSSLSMVFVFSFKRDSAASYRGFRQLGQLRQCRE